MLSKLLVKNFALIDDLEIEFKNGLTALTGETGSGKSILLESLSLLFGKRSDAEYIRHGKSKAEVTGQFLLNQVQQKALELPEEITLHREIDGSGRHTIRLNGEIITLARLKSITSLIGLIHGQNDTYMLFDKASYVTFIDQMDLNKATDLLQKYLIKRSKYQEAKAHLESLKSKKQESLERIDYLTFQVKELEGLNLLQNEKEELEEKIEKLKNFDLIQSALKQANEALNSQTFQMDDLYLAYKQIAKIAEYDKSYEMLSKNLEDSYYTLEDSIKTSSILLKNLDFDDEAFNMYQQRVFELNKIEVKYGKTVNDLIEYLAKIKEELALSSDYEGYLKEVKQKCDKLYDEAYQDATKLHELRLKLAKHLEDDLTKNLRELDLEKAEFKIEFDEIKHGMTLDETGVDAVEFMISLNEGEPKKPLSKVASGGEKARFMFSLKSLFAKNSGLSMLVFDEIDIGISGKTAAKVASKMKEISTELQTLVITHLPQVAAKADYHYSIYKTKVDDRMQTFIELLSQDDRVLSIAGMLSDDSISPYAIEQAKALLSK